MATTLLLSRHVQAQGCQRLQSAHQAHLHVRKTFGPWNHACHCHLLFSPVSGQSRPTVLGKHTLSMAALGPIAAVCIMHTPGHAYWMPMAHTDVTHTQADLYSSVQSCWFQCLAQG